MTNSSVIVVSLALMFLGRAQSQPALFTTAIDSDGQLTLTVQNLGTSALTAFAYIADIHAKAGEEIRLETIQEHSLNDFLLSLGDPLMPSQTRSFHVSGWYGTVISEAALWADGSSFGDPVLIQKLTQRRALARRHIDLVLSILLEARRSSRSLSETAAWVGNTEAQVDQDTQDMDVAGNLRIYYEQAKRRLTGSRLKHSSDLPFNDAETLDQAIREQENYRQHASLY
jgi:hypothetical protein